MTVKLGRYLAALTIAVPLSGACAQPRSGISVTIDTSAAEAVLKAVTGDLTDAESLARTALELPGIQAMIAKEHRYVPAASADSFIAAVLATVNGRGGEPFALREIRDNPAQVRTLLANLTSRKTELSGRLTDRLGMYAPRGLTLHTTLAVVLGSHQNGWVPDQKTPVFYIDAGFQSGDADALIAVAAHELFHVVQGAVQPDWSAALAASTSSSPEMREMHNVHAALLNLVIEGMADYVGDPRALPGDGSGIERARREYTRNLARSSESFALFDTIIYRLYRDPDAPLESLLNIGFGGSWEQTGYYVGFAMASAIERYVGRERLQELVASPPEDFVLEYVAVERRAADRNLMRPAASSVEAASASRRSLSAHGTPAR
jgi:hypothetical protein